MGDNLSLAPRPGIVMLPEFEAVEENGTYWAEPLVDPDVPQYRLLPQPAFAVTEKPADRANAIAIFIKALLTVIEGFIVIPFNSFPHRFAKIVQTQAISLLKRKRPAFAG